VEGVEDKGGDVAGYMPLQRQVGFIYDSPNLFIIAHELGHGAFNLRHTFSPESFIAAERTTQNLMDYNGGTELWKHQWEFIRDPQNIWFAWAQDEGEGEMIISKNAIETIKAANELLKSSIEVSENWKTEESISIQLDKSPLLPTTIITKVLKAKVQISTQDFKKEVLSKTKEVKITFMDQASQDQPAVTFQLPLDKEDLFLQYLRISSKIAEFPCKKCGKELKINHQNLMDIFPNSTIVRNNPNSATLFQTAFEKVPLNSCYRIAHLLSQVNHESGGMTAKTEDLDYSLIRLFEMFNTTLSAKMFFKQSFWDSKEYLKYAVANLYEMVDTAKGEKGDYDAASFATFKYNNSSTDTIRIPVSFTLNKGKGSYKKVSLTDAEKQSNREKWVNQVYGRSDLGNGGPETGDGYKYRGRGAIQLTGKYNYERVGKKCNDMFGTAYNWVANPESVANDIQANIYSAIAYILVYFNDLSLLDGTDVSAVTKKINTMEDGLSNRKAKFDTLIQTHYKCEKK